MWCAHMKNSPHWVLKRYAPFYRCILIFKKQRIKNIVKRLYIKPHTLVSSGEDLAGVTERKIFSQIFL